MSVCIASDIELIQAAALPSVLCIADSVSRSCLVCSSMSCSSSVVQQVSLVAVCCGRMTCVTQRSRVVSWKRPHRTPHVSMLRAVMFAANA